MGDVRETDSNEVAELKAISLNAGVLSDLAEKWLPAIKNTVDSGLVDLIAEVRSVRGVLQAILGVLVVIAIILLMK